MITENTLLGLDLFKDVFQKSLVFHIPHSSVEIPCEYKSDYVDDYLVENEIKLLTDYSTDEIFNIEGTDKLVFPYSRVFCDVERLDDDSEVMFKYGRGFYYTKTDDGKEFRKNSNKDIVYENYYKKHHQSLTLLVDKKIKENGFVTIIDCHSYSNTPFKSDLEQSTKRPDFCLGTDDFHTPSWLVGSLNNFLIKNGYRVEINYPYQGTIVPIEYFKKKENIHSIMIEVNRDLYMKDGIVNHNSVKYLSNLFNNFFFDF